MEFKKPKNCPKCSSMRFAQILYGRPTSDAMDGVDRGEIVLGGCFIMFDQPDWECSSCGHQWYDADDPACIRWEKLINDLRNDDSENDDEDETVTIEEQ